MRCLLQFACELNINRVRVRTEYQRTPADLARLEHIRNLVAAKHPSAESARLLLFSASRFERNLTEQAAKRDDVELINLERLYTGD